MLTPNTPPQSLIQLTILLSGKDFISFHEPLSVKDIVIGNIKSPHKDINYTGNFDTNWNLYLQGLITLEPIFLAGD